MASDLGLSDDISDLSGTRTRSRGNPSESDGGGLWPRIRLAAAILFAASTVLYSAIWMYYVRISPQASLGFDFQEHISQKYVEITRVYPGGAAERAGLHAGDRLISVYGRPFYSREPLYTAFVGGHAGDPCRSQCCVPGVALPNQLPWCSIRRRRTRGREVPARS